VAKLRIDLPNAVQLAPESVQTPRVALQLQELAPEEERPSAAGLLESEGSEATALQPPTASQPPEISGAAAAPAEALTTAGSGK